MMFAKNAAYAEAKKFDATLTWDELGSIFIIHVSAPVGHHWSDGRVHELRIEGRPTSGKDMDDLFIDAINRMRAGLEECDLNDQACADNAF
jgi:hypothetical protein